jgi:hypothetical protein
MPDQEDDAELKRRRHAAMMQDTLENTERIETWISQLPELRALLDWRADAHQVAEALARAAACLYGMLGENVIAQRLEEAIERKSHPGAALIWGRERFQHQLFVEMVAELAGQAKPSVAAAARALAAREPWRSQDVTAEAIRQRWVVVAKFNGISGTELVRRALEEARGREDQAR